MVTLQISGASTTWEARHLRPNARCQFKAGAECVNCGASLGLAKGPLHYGGTSVSGSLLSREVRGALITDRSRAMLESDKDIGGTSVDRPRGKRLYSSCQTLLATLRKRPVHAAHHLSSSHSRSLSQRRDQSNGVARAATNTVPRGKVSSMGGVSAADEDESCVLHRFRARASRQAFRMRTTNMIFVEEVVRRRDARLRRGVLLSSSRMPFGLQSGARSTLQAREPVKRVARRELKLGGVKPRAVNWGRMVSAGKVDARESEEEFEEETSSQTGEKDGLGEREEDEARKEGLVTGKEATGRNDSMSFTLGGTFFGIAVLVGSVVAVGGMGWLFKDQINSFLAFFSAALEGMGYPGYLVFILVYASLEILAIPAIPLTMAAGLLFGVVRGTILVSISGTIAATIAFLIARYVARDKIVQMTSHYPKFAAIDKAVGKDSFRVVTLLRLSPLLPFSLGNYFYGLTSVRLVPYVIGSWIGMLPGTWAYVCAGSVSKSLLQEQVSEFSLPFTGGAEMWAFGIGVATTMIATVYVTGLVKDAIDDAES